jgi:hypothetical protein
LLFAVRFKADFGVSCLLLLAFSESVAFPTDNFLRLPETRSTDLACRCFDCSESAPESEVGIFFSFFDFLPSSVLVCFDFSWGAAVFDFVVRFFLIFFLLLDVDLVCPDAGFPEATLGFGLSLGSCSFDFVRSRCLLETRIDPSSDFCSDLSLFSFSSFLFLRAPGRGNVAEVEEGCDLVFGGTIFPCPAWTGC